MTLNKTEADGAHTNRLIPLMSEANNGKIDFFDLWCLWRLDFVTFMGRRYLPRGYWGHNPNCTFNERHERDTTLGLSEKVFLTFDDGPHPATTPYLLELLEEQDVTATFFVIGRRVDRYPELARQIVNKGHAIANHSFNHHLLPILSRKKMEAEIIKTSDIIQGATGQAPRLFRPPFGIIDRRGAECVSELSMKMIYWGPVSEDWKPIGVRRVVERTMKRVSPGSLIVLHEGPGTAKQTGEATLEIIRKTRQLGFKFSRLETII